MKIYYDYQIFLHQKYGGISKYFINLVKNINKKSKSLIIAPFHKNYYLNLQNQKTKKFFYFNFKTRNINFLSNQVNKFYTKLYYNTNPPDIFHFTYFNKKYYLNKKAKHVITIYDLIKEIYYKDEFKKEQIFKKEYFKNIDKIICISENTKKDLLNFYDLNPDLIKVVYLGVDQNKNFINMGKIKIDKPYILFVGNRERYKNFKSFIIAYSKSDKLKKDFDIICFGGQNFNNKDVLLFKDLNILENIKYVEGSDLELNFFYKNAKAFIFPSLYEGFGLPLLESMKMNCPVFCSNTSSFKEIANNSAIFFDPKNIEEIKFQIESNIYDNQRMNEIILNGKKNIQKFSWKKCANETLEVYQDLL